MGGGRGMPMPAPAAPELEPVKSAEQAIKEAGTPSGRSDQLRRGLASTFSRSTMGGGSISSKATSGSATKLGN